MRYLILLLTLNLAFNTNWIDLGSPYPKDCEKRILSSDLDNTQIQFSISGYYQTLVETSKGPAYIIDAKNGASLLKEGAPDLDKITIPIKIPNQANMNYRIISAEYIDIQ